jgi:hypothetical protein
MPTSNLYRGPSLRGYATPVSAPIYVDSDDNRVKTIPTGSGSTEVILQETGGAGTAEVLITTRVLTAVDAGKKFFLNLAAGFTVTLPAHSATPIGATFDFYTQIVPTTAYIIVSNSADVNTMAGGVNELETDTTEDGPYSAGADTFTFVASALGSIGDWVRFVNTGTFWMVTGQFNLDGGATIA